MMMMTMTMVMTMTMMMMVTSVIKQSSCEEIHATGLQMPASEKTHREAAHQGVEAHLKGQQEVHHV
eukprot:1901835-Karenia_brevis.AAC.1